ncbi:hypothetical protein BCV64_15615 [Cylindrospermopsis raciborskii MVCC14]|nr:hypothetical protein BCV64_15615 [Cylindrospermopsis raciborskii MVCC14]
MEIGQLTNIYERWKFLYVTLCMSGQEGRDPKPHDNQPPPSPHPNPPSRQPARAGALTVLFL